MSKRDLYFRKPLMNAAGTLGFSPDPRASVAWEDLGAFVTNPISLRPRLAFLFARERKPLRRRQKTTRRRTRPRV